MIISYLFELLAKIVITTIEFTGYSGVFFLMLVESCGIPMPSEIIMPFAGFLVNQGKFNFWLVSIAGALGNLAGSLLAYYIGAKGGRLLLEKYGKYILISKHDLDTADRWFNKYGNLAVFFGRLLPVIRTYISFPAGIAKMDIKKFSIYTFLGALPWCILFTWLGTKLGDNWEVIREKMHNFDLLILFLIILLIVYYLMRHIKSRKKIPS